MRYSEWVATVSEAIRGDALWRVEVYRLRLFVADIGWHDVTRLNRDRRTLGLADQLYRALGSISANIAEGYSRKSGRDQARFFEYAPGSARERRDWYHKARHLLGDQVTNHRIDLLTSVIRLLLQKIPDRRSQSINDPGLSYDSPTTPEPESYPGAPFSSRLENVSMPNDNSPAPET